MTAPVARVPDYRSSLRFREKTPRQAELQYGKDKAATGNLKKLKEVFDPKGILNPGKLTEYERTVR